MGDSSKWKYRPNMINIETVQGCNRHCDFCGTMGMEDKIHRADMETIIHTLKLIRDADLNCQIRLAGHGEPTLHPKLVQIVRTIRQYLPKTTIHLFTNGTVIEKKPSLVDDLFGAGLNNLIVDEYSDHPVGIFVRTDPTCLKYEIVEQGAGTHLFSDKNPKARRICIVPPIDGNKNTVNRKLCNQCGAALPPLKEQNGKKCSVIFREMTVRWDGNIAICCNDFRGYYRVTNIMLCQKLEQAWFHKRFESARKYLYYGKRDFFPCSVCDVLPNRPGLLPDWSGKGTMPAPTAADREIVNLRCEPCSVIRKREWEA